MTGAAEQSPSLFALSSSQETEFSTFNSADGRLGSVFRSAIASGVGLLLKIIAPVSKAWVLLWQRLGFSAPCPGMPAAHRHFL